MGKIEDKVLVFVRSAESPSVILTAENVRIAYGDYWVDFRDGAVKVTKEESS